MVGSSAVFLRVCLFLFFFFFNDTATTEIYTLSLHDALPICLENLALARGWRGSVWFSEIKLPDSAHLEASLEKLRREIVPPFNKFAQTFTACERQPTGPELAEAIRGLWSELQVLETLEAWSDSARAAGAETHDALG